MAILGKGKLTFPRSQGFQGLGRAGGCEPLTKATPLQQNFPQNQEVMRLRAMNNKSPWVAQAHTTALMLLLRVAKATTGAVPSGT